MALRGTMSKTYESYELTGKGLTTLANGTSVPVMLAVPESIRKIEAEEAAREADRAARETARIQTIREELKEAGVEDVDSIPADRLAKV